METMKLDPFLEIFVNVLIQ